MASNTVTYRRLRGAPEVPFAALSLRSEQSSRRIDGGSGLSWPQGELTSEAKLFDGRPNLAEQAVATGLGLSYQPRR